MCVRPLLLVFLLGWGICCSFSPARAAEIEQRIDTLLAEKWNAAGIAPAAPADDAEFLRRVTLDLTGGIPTVSEVRAFLADQRSDKRSALIDRLLARPRHAGYRAELWQEALLPANATARQFGGQGLGTWLQQRFAANEPYQRTVADLLTATGQFGQGPAAFFLSQELKPEELASSTSRVFLGVQISCAQCHNHPFAAWKMQDFWGYAAFFARLQRPQQPNQFAGVLADAEQGEVRLPNSDTVVGMKFLGAAEATDRAEVTRRAQLAAWLTAADNPYFAPATVNRVWAQMFGRGIVEPIDDFGPHNPASLPEVLDALSQHFVASGYDLRELYRTLASTRAYQLSSESPGVEAERPELFARMAIKSLSAGQLYDGLTEAMRRREPAAARGQFAGQFTVFDANRQTFIQKFQAPQQSVTELHAGIPQALTLMNGALIREATDLAQSDLLVALEAPFLSPEDRVETIFLSTLSRYPREEERATFLAHLKSSPPERQRHALADMFWAVLNSAEFMLNH